MAFFMVWIYCHIFTSGCFACELTPEIIIVIFKQNYFTLSATGFGVFYLPHDSYENRKEQKQFFLGTK